MHASGDLGDPYFHLTVINSETAINAVESHAMPDGLLGTVGGTISSAPVAFPAWRLSLSVDVNMLARLLRAQYLRVRYPI